MNIDEAFEIALVQAKDLQAKAVPEAAAPTVSAVSKDVTSIFFTCEL